MSDENNKLVVFEDRTDDTLKNMKTSLDLSVQKHSRDFEKLMRFESAQNHLSQNLVSHKGFLKSSEMSADYEVMVIWPHGCSRFNEIVHCLHSNKFSIHWVEKLEFNNKQEFSDFVKKLYSFDHLPEKHLQKKMTDLNNLCSSEMKTIFVLIYSTKDSIRKLFGSPPFQVLKNIWGNKVKEMIRNK